jgi:hypothetical protein
MQCPRFASIAGCLKHGRGGVSNSIKVIIIHIGENDICGYSTPFSVAMRLGETPAFEICEFFLSEKQNRGMLFECPSLLQESAMAERSRKSRPTAGLCATQRGADELRRRIANSSPMNEGGNFPLCKASRTRKTRKGSCYGRAPFTPLVAPSRGCPEMAPQRLEKIESAPENGMVSEAIEATTSGVRARGSPCAPAN